MVNSINYIKALTGLTMMVLLQNGDCLMCYSCDSLMHNDCANLNAVSDKYLVDCASLEKFGIKRENPVCFQAHGKVNLMIAEGGAVVRGCAEKPVSDNACSNYQVSGFHFVGVNCTSCSEDKCNGDYIATASPALIIPTLPPTRKPKDTGGASAFSPTYGLLVLPLGYLLATVF